MNIRLNLWLGILVAAAAIATAARAAGPTAASGEPDDARIDAIVRKLEQSGALDAAVERAIDRYVQRKQAERQSGQSESAKRARPVDAQQDHIQGKAGAEVSLIEYTDFECPYCKRFHGTPGPLLARYSGRVNWVVRNYPLSFHNPAARQESLAAECVATLGGNDAYWKYADALFANTRSNGTGLPEGKSMESLAEALGVKGGALTACMNESGGAAAQRVDRDIADGTATGVSGTPTTIVRNNRTGASEALVGALPADALVAAIERMLKAKP